MINLFVEKMINANISIEPMSIRREWMDQTPEKHAYRCFPVTQANMIGWTLSSDKDIRFIWNGVNDTSSANVEILEGQEYVYTGRGQSTISFSTGLVFRSDQNISLLTINPSNYFNEDFETMSSVISTSFYDQSLPLAIKAKIPNKEVLIKSGQPIATIIPISLGLLDDTCIEIVDYQDPNNKRAEASRSYGEEAQKLNQSGQWTDWYRDAVNEKGESLGQHEVKALRLSVKDSRKNGIM
jgi:hypothetical protein